MLYSFKVKCSWLFHSFKTLMQLMKQVRRNSTRSSRTAADRDCELTDWQVALGGLGGFEHQVGNFKKLKDLPPRKTNDNGTSTMNKDLFNYFLWNMVIFQCHVSFQGCNSSTHLVTEVQLYCRRCYKMLVLLQLLQPTCAKVRFFFEMLEKCLWIWDRNQGIRTSEAATILDKFFLEVQIPPSMT